VKRVAVVLAYDELPEGSDISREFREDGVTLIIPAGQLAAAGRRRAYALAINPAAMISLQALGFAFAITWFAFLRFSYPPQVLLPVIIALLCIITAAVFALVLRALGMSRVHAIENARQQSTVINATKERLAIESAGPVGAISTSVPRDQIEWLDLATQPHRGIALAAVRVMLSKKRVISIGLGRDELELRWVVRILRNTLAIPDSLTVPSQS
jgi:hypothetical protein